MHYIDKSDPIVWMGRFLHAHFFVGNGAHGIGQSGGISLTMRPCDVKMDKMANEYMFFDMECADGTHVCSVGYVICDAAFVVREKRDMLIDPQCKFKLSRAGFDPWIRLAYPEKAFYDSPTFAARYTELQALFTAPDRVFLGHSILSDLHFLAAACARYHKPQLLPDVYDTQKFYAAYTEQKQMRSLEAIVQDLGIDASHLCEHKSCDDAEMSMLVAKELCARYECTLPALLQKHRGTVVRGKDAVLAQAVRHLKKQYPHPPNRRVPAVCLGDTDDYDVDARIRLAQALYRKGYAYAESVAKCRFFVSFGYSGAREEAFAKAVAAGKRIRKITPDELSRMLGVTVDSRGGIE